MKGLSGSSRVAFVLSVLTIACADTSISSEGSTGADEVGEPDATDQGQEDDGSPAGAYETFFIGESTKFDGGGACENEDVSTVTSTLRNRLDKAGWSGLRFVDDNSWPEDFWERSILALGLDDTYGDQASLVVYAGHGNVGRLQWGRPSDNGNCRARIRTEVRLGRLAGDRARVAMFLTSCTSRQDLLWSSYRQNAFRQVLGYHNSPYVGYDEARKVFKRTQDGQPTAYAWLDEMENNGAPGKNSPVTTTLGSSAAEAEAVHPHTNLADGEGLLGELPEPAGGYYFEMYDNGCTSPCGSCSSSLQSMPEVSMGQVVTRLELTRPQRGRVELRERASGLVLALGGAFDPSEDERLARWAAEIEASGSLAFVSLLCDGEIFDLSYDPDNDELRVSNRSALERARPSVNRHRMVADTLSMDETQTIAEGTLARLRDQLDASMTWDAAMEVATRSGGFGSREDEGTAPATPFEYLFSIRPRVDGFEISGAELRVGVTRLGELSSVVLSEVSAQPAGAAKIQRTVKQAVADLEAGLRAVEPGMGELVFDELRLGYALSEGERAAVVEPGVLVGHVAAFAQGESVSRRVPLRVPLTCTACDPVLLAQADPSPSPGDSRAPR
nr:DUF6345 domain-containing protein [Pseudenhygromyxa sp. WMMC2535]